MNNKCITCKQEDAEWVDLYCQMCWEDYCAGEWWKTVLHGSNEEELSDV